jgi:sulfide:quinone oxidoreductase
MNQEFRFVVVGGGTGGITVAARLRRKFPKDSIAIIEPSDAHFYQPLWTLVGAGIVSKETTKKPMADVIPPGVTWLKNSVEELIPQQNQVRLESKETVTYSYLILSPGLKVSFDKEIIKRYPTFF